MDDDDPKGMWLKQCHDTVRAFVVLVSEPKSSQKLAEIVKATKVLERKRTSDLVLLIVIRRAQLSFRVVCFCISDWGASAENLCPRINVTCLGTLGLVPPTATPTGRGGRQRISRACPSHFHQCCTLFGGRNCYNFQEFAAARTMRCSQQPTRPTHGQDSLRCSTTPRCAASRSGSRMSEWFIESLTEGSVVSQARTWAVCRVLSKLCFRVYVAIFSSGGSLPRPTSPSVCLFHDPVTREVHNRTIVPSVVLRHRIARITTRSSSPECCKALTTPPTRGSCPTRSSSCLMASSTVSPPTYYAVSKMRSRRSSTPRPRSYIASTTLPL